MNRRIMAITLPFHGKNNGSIPLGFNMILNNNPKLINITTTQQHPFHVLTSSKLPILTSTLSGILALTLIAKLHNILPTDLYTFSYILALVLDPLYAIGGLYSMSYNLSILTLISFLIAAI